MNDGSMFADLCLYKNEDFYKEHKIICFDPLDSYDTYEIIAAFKAVAYSKDGFKYDRVSLCFPMSDFTILSGTAQECATV